MENNKNSQNNTKTLSPEDIKVKDCTTPSSRQAFIYTKYHDIIPVEIYGIQKTCEGYLLHIEGDISIQSLHDIMPQHASRYIFFCLHCASWRSQIATLNNASIDNNLIIIANSLPTDLQGLTSQEINTLLRKQRITLIIDPSQQLLSPTYQDQKCMLITLTPNSMECSAIANTTNINALIKHIAQDTSSHLHTNSRDNHINRILPQNNIFLPKTTNKNDLPQTCTTMCANHITRTQHINVFHSHNTIIIPDYGVSPVAITTLNQYFNIHIIPLQYDIDKYLYVNYKQYIPFNGIVLPSSLCDKADIDAEIKNKILALISTKKPILAFGFGNMLLADILHFSLIHNISNACINNYNIYDNYNNIYSTSILQEGWFSDIPHHFHATFYNQKNHNIVGMENEMICAYAFDCFNNTTYTARILDRFEKKMNATNK